MVTLVFQKYENRRNKIVLMNTLSVKTFNIILYYSNSWS